MLGLSIPESFLLLFFLTLEEKCCDKWKIRREELVAWEPTVNIENIFYLKYGV